MLNEKELESLRTEVAFKQIITSDSQLLGILHQLKGAASQKIHILIQGETGTGKELCAEAIHFLSPRRDKPFISLNCGIGTTELFDSVFFGHVRGAFTGAITNRPGLVEEADKGILFLDEINSMPVSCQIKLNRFLDKGEFRRLGENKLRKVDVQFIFASNRHLGNEVAQARFRNDLFYRINEYMIEIPPLRKRRDDIRLLMDYFLEKYRKQFHKPGLKFCDTVYRMAQQYPWPGNIRELENVIKRCIIDATTDRIIKPEDFPLQQLPQISPIKDEYLSLPLQEAKTKVVDEFEALYLQHQLRCCNGNVEECARRCKKHRSAFWALLKKHNLDPKMYRK